LVTDILFSVAVELNLERGRFVPGVPDVCDKIVASPNQGTIKEVGLMLSILDIGSCIGIGDFGILCDHGGGNGRGCDCGSCDNRNKRDLWDGDNWCGWLGNRQGLGNVGCSLALYCSRKLDIRIIGNVKD
jgi:hypothetical protein